MENNFNASNFHFQQLILNWLFVGNLKRIIFIQDLDLGYEI